MIPSPTGQTDNQALYRGAHPEGARNGSESGNGVLGDFARVEIWSNCSFSRWGVEARGEIKITINDTVTTPGGAEVAGINPGPPPGKLTAFLARGSC